MTAAKIRWKCSGITCTAEVADGGDPLRFNQLEICQDLARQVGPFKGYRYGETYMDDGALSRCNAEPAAAVLR